MIPKNRIHLCRNLHAQTTPYPDAGKWFRRIAIFCVFGLVMGIFFATQPKRHAADTPQTKQILGEQNQSAPTEYETYEIKQGDTLFNLSQNRRVSWQTLAEINNLKEPYVLKIGQKIKIPQ